MKTGMQSPAGLRRRKELELEFLEMFAISSDDYFQDR
jgi:hypothetical protein